MKQIYNLVVGFFLICFLMIIITSCIREDISGCIPDRRTKEIRLSFSFPVKEPGSRVGIDPKDIKDIKVFVFDQSKTFLKEIIDNQPDLSNNDYHIDMILDEGEYNFLVWGNLNGCYQMQPYPFVQKGTRLDDASLYLKCAGNDTVNFLPHPLFFTSKEEVTLKSDIDTLYYILPLIQDTYTINLVVEGLPAEGNTYRFVITDTNGTYTFDNSFVPGEELHYIGDCMQTAKSEQIGSSITTMRLAKNRSPQLKLYDSRTGNLIYEENLMTLLRWMEEAGGELDLSRIYEYDILLKFSEDAETGEVTFSVMVNDWTVIEKEVVIDLSKSNQSKYNSN